MSWMGLSLPGAIVVSERDCSGPGTSAWPTRAMRWSTSTSPSGVLASVSLIDASTKAASPRRVTETMLVPTGMARSSGYVVRRTAASVPAAGSPAAANRASEA